MKEFIPLMALNPTIFRWARTTAGFSLDQAAAALGFGDTRRRSAEDRLAALESGEETPSRSVILKMAKVYRRSLLVFYLSDPPRPGNRGQDFRLVPGGREVQAEPLLDALIRDLQGRQAIVRSILEEGEPQNLAFIGSASMNVPAGVLLNQITEKINFSLSEFHSQADINEAFKYLREKVEASGVFVILLGNLGSHHTNISPESFRGFAIADPIAPFIVVNDRDAKAAWSFTVLHELVHLWLGTTGISGASFDSQIETFCNDIAGEILLPSSELGALSFVRQGSLEEAIEVISSFAERRKISRAMVAYKLLRTGTIDQSKWRRLSDHFRQEFLERRARNEVPEQREGGPNYYVVKRHRLGQALLNLVRNSLTEGSLTYTKAGQILGVKPRNVEPLVHEITTQGGR